MIRLATLCFAVLLLSSCAPAPHVSTAARAELAPTGRLRVGINVQNFLLVNKERSGGQYSGIAVDLGRELGKRLGVPVELVPFDTAGKLADAVKSGAWDVAFLGNEPARTNEIAFSAAYLEIEAGYLVPAGSPIRTIEDVDREGVRVAVNAKSAYDLYLTRNLHRAKLFRAPTVDASYELFVSDKLDALAGLKPRLVMDAEKLPGSRVLEGRFSAGEIGRAACRGRVEISGVAVSFKKKKRSSKLVHE